MNLHPTITSSIIDSLGIYTKQMPDIRINQYKAGSNIYAGYTDISATDKISILYKEQNDAKYMTIKFANTDIWFCLISFEEDNDDNNTFVAKIIDNKFHFRNISNIELANLLVSFEIVKQYASCWKPYKPQKAEFELLNSFISNEFILSVKENYDSKR
jgi:hypothetical protein